MMYMQLIIKNLELKKSGKFCFYLCEFLSSKFNLLEPIAKVFKKRDCFASLAMTNGVFAVIARSAATNLKKFDFCLLYNLLYCILAMVPGPGIV